MGLLISFTISPSATAQEDLNYFVIKAGIYSPTGDLDDADFDSGFDGEVVVGHYIQPNFCIEGAVGYFRSDASYGGFDPFLVGF